MTPEEIRAKAGEIVNRQLAATKAFGDATEELFALQDECEHPTCSDWKYTGNSEGSIRLRIKKCKDCEKEIIEKV